MSGSYGRHSVQACRGKVLDIGAGAGSHALWLQENCCDVTALDVSPGAVETMRLRGVKSAVQSDLAEFRTTGFDTLLLLMNGIGLCGRRERLPAWLTHLQQLLAPGGQILLDSSDLKYLFADHRADMEGPDYYGHVTYQMEFEGALTEWFDWLYLAPANLQSDTQALNWKCDILHHGPHYDFLARLTVA